MKKALALLLVLSFTTVGCTGTFQLTRNVYDFHRSQDNKWVDEAIFLGTIILPVYGLATLADAILFNTVEFWTGENPLLASDADKTQRIALNDGQEAEVSYNDANDQIMIKTDDQTLVLERSEFGVIAKDLDGNVLYTSVKNSHGDVLVYDQNLDLVDTASADKLAMASQKYLQ